MKFSMTGEEKCDL